MKIGIEAQRLFRKNKHGMDYVALELIKNLMDIDKENQYYIFVAPGEDKCLANTLNFKIIEVRGGIYPLWEQISLPKAVKKAGCDILHCTSNTAPLFVNVPLVITLHDIIYLESNALFKKEGTWYQKFGNVYRSFIVPRVFRKSLKVITVSKFEKGRIKDHFKMGSDDNRVQVVYNGVSSHFVPVIDKEVLNDTRKRYGLPEKFIFHLGNTDPKKNTAGVLKAYNDFLSRSEEKIPLVMPDYDRDELASILNSIGNKNLIDNIILTGYIKNTDLPSLYSLCEIFLYPSIRESFGLPILEAMRCGAPVITSDTSSLPEISGGAAVTINPLSHEEITIAMEEIIRNVSFKRNLRMKGFRQTFNFSWRRMAEEVFEIYNVAYDGNL
jgi:glycosyltransferase involved in cell wall biosynthesis